MLENSSRRRFVRSPRAAAGAVLADAGQIQQVLMNLAVNAGHAMPDGGVLRIATAARELRVAAPSGGLLPGRYAEIAVADTGAGIEERHRARIFEPFFTTKGPGEGTGLGLAMVFGIVKAHEGTIAVDSGPGAAQPSASSCRSSPGGGRALAASGEAAPEHAGRGANPDRGRRGNGPRWPWRIAHQRRLPRADRAGRGDRSALPAGGSWGSTS